MKTIWISTISFIAGAGTTYLYLKNKFEQQANEEVAEAREFYKKEMENFVTEVAATDVEEPVIEITEEEKVDYSKISANYTEEKPKKKGGRKKKTKINPGLIISSDEFIDLNGYDKKTIFYFNEDNVFTDDHYQVIEDAELIIGIDNLDSVALYEEGTMYVRCDDYSTDYEVILKEESYKDYAEE